MESVNGISGRPQPSYAARLFLVQENVILVAGAALFSVAWASPLPLVAAVAGELLWLAIGSSSPGVRRWLDRREASMRRVEADRVVTSSREPLDADYARRVLMLERALGDIRDIGGRRPSPMFERALARLETLKPVYLGLCATHQRIARFLAATTAAELVAEAERLKAVFTAEKDLGVRLTLRQSLGLAQRRIEHQKSMAMTFRSIDVKLESVERSVAYLRSQGLGLTSNSQLLEEVEALISEIGPAIEVEPNGTPGLSPA